MSLIKHIMHVPQVLKLFISFIYALLFQVKFPFVPAASRQWLFPASTGTGVCTVRLELQWQQSVMLNVWERRKRKKSFSAQFPHFSVVGALQTCQSHYAAGGAVLGMAPTRKPG